MTPPPVSPSDDPGTGFQQYLEALATDVSPLMRSVTVRGGDVFGGMCLFYLQRQLDHTEALLRLNDHPDASLIVRSMLEGLCQLSWTRAEPEQRAARWRDYAHVGNWRRAKLRLEDGLPPMGADLAQMEEAVKPFQELFFNERARKAAAKGKPLPDEPFVGNWTGLTVRGLFEAVDALSHYRWSYRVLSDWHHWSANIMQQSIHVEGQRFSYLPPVERAKPANFLTALQALLGVAQTADLWFKWGQAEVFRTHENAVVAYGTVHRRTTPAG